MHGIDPLSASFLRKTKGRDVFECLKIYAPHTWNWGPTCHEIWIWTLESIDWYEPWQIGLFSVISDQLRDDLQATVTNLCQQSGPITCQSGPIACHRCQLHVTVHCFCIAKRLGKRSGPQFSFSHRRMSRQALLVGRNRISRFSISYMKFKYVEGRFLTTVRPGSVANLPFILVTVDSILLGT